MIPSPLKKWLESSFVRGCRHEAELNSTNDFAIQHAATIDAAQLPYLVLADQQTAGRGRGANRWWSAQGALTFSLIVEPEQWRIGAHLWPRLSVAVGGAVAEALRELAPGEDVRLKWPNDVYLRGRKVSGILVETLPSTPKRLVIGIGVNVENSFQDAPAEVASRAISLVDALPEPPGRFETLAAILRHLDADFQSLTTNPKSLTNRWRERCFLTGKFISIGDVERTLSGTCLGLEDDASLLIQTEAGPQRCYAGVVTVTD